MVEGVNDGAERGGVAVNEGQERSKHERLVKRAVHKREGWYKRAEKEHHGSKGRRHLWSDENNGACQCAPFHIVLTATDQSYLTTTGSHTAAGQRA